MVYLPSNQDREQEEHYGEQVEKVQGRKVPSCKDYYLVKVVALSKEKLCCDN